MCKKRETRYAVYGAKNSNGNYRLIKTVTTETADITGSGDTYFKVKALHAPSDENVNEVTSDFSETVTFSQ